MKGRHRERSSLHWFTPQMFTRAGAGPGERQQLVTPSRSPLFQSWDLDHLQPPKVYSSRELDCKQRQDFWKSGCYATLPNIPATVSTFNMPNSMLTSYPKPSVSPIAYKIRSALLSPPEVGSDLSSQESAVLSTGSAGYSLSCSWVSRSPNPLLHDPASILSPLSGLSMCKGVVLSHIWMCTLQMLTAQRKKRHLPGKFWYNQSHLALMAHLPCLTFAYSVFPRRHAVINLPVQV